MNITQRVKQLLSQPRDILNPLLLCSFTALWIRDFLYWIPKDAFGTSLNYWAFTDWLIDYSQGFIRRGMSGEIWRLIPTSVPPLQFVAVFSWVLILVIVLGYIRLLARSWKSFHPLTLFGLLFLPSLFMFYLHDHQTIARKEILGYVTVLLHLLVIERSFPVGGESTIPAGNLRRYVGWMLPITMILLPLIILTHEGNFLLFVPFHAVITLTVLRVEGKPGLTRAAVWTGLLYLPAALIFAAVYLAGTPNYAMLLGICQKWIPAGAIREGSCVLPPEKLSASTLPGSFIPMQWTLPRAAGITAMVISRNWIAWILILPALSGMLCYLARQSVYSALRFRFPRTFSRQPALKYAKDFFIRFFVIPFAASVPVYFTAYDYGRWFTVACVNFALVAVSLNLPCREYARRLKNTGDGPGAAASPEFVDRRWVFYGVSIVICVLVLVLWLPHYCLFNCDIARSPIEFLSHSFKAD
jgi:hypothetical protein